MNSKFYRKVLKNGLTILFEKRDLPIVSVGIAVRNGGINESEEERGISHYIEHMLYKGTPTRNFKKIAEEIERNGGDLNGFTSETITAYWCKMPSNHLNTALNVLSDMVQNPLFDEKELEKEKKVIFEEIKMRKDSPMGHVFNEIHKRLYEKPFEIPVIGTEKTLNLINREKIIKKFGEVYKPNNFILCIVGDANFEDIVNFAEKTFLNNSFGKVSEFKINTKIEIKVEKRKGLDQANFVLAYHVPLSDDKLSYAETVLITLMAGGMSSRLFQEIREKRNLAYGVKGGSDINKDFAYSFIYVGTTKENLDLVEKLILKEFENVSKELSEKELNEVKNQLIGNYRISMEDSQTQLDNLLSFEVNGNAENFYEFEKNISEVKLEDVKKLAKKVKKGNYSSFTLLPE